VLYFAIATTAAYILLIVAATSYLIAYHYYVPHAATIADLDLDFSFIGDGAYAAVDISNMRLSLVPYKIAVRLDLPRDHYNQELGNFMVRMTTLDSGLDAFLDQHLTLTANSSLIARITRWPLTYDHGYVLDRKPFMKTRPAILPYRSDLLESVDTMLFSPLYLTNLMSQRSLVDIEMVDWTSTATQNANYVVVELDRTVHINGASLVWTVQWQGIRYLMHQYKIIMFVVGTWFFWFIETVAMLLVAYFLFQMYSASEQGLSVPPTPIRVPSPPPPQQKPTPVFTPVPSPQRPELSLLDSLGPDPGPPTPAPTPIAWPSEEDTFESVGESVEESVSESMVESVEDLTSMEDTEEGAEDTIESSHHDNNDIDILTS
jgi:hypothetical protein